MLAQPAAVGVAAVVASSGEGIWHDRIQRGTRWRWAASVTGGNHQKRPPRHVPALVD
jgi:hypothetical protein